MSILGGNREEKLWETIIRKRVHKKRMKIPTTALLRALLWLGTTIASFGADVKIKNVDEFIAFANDVNNGTDYYEKIVFLDSDMDLTGRTFEPIGNYTSSYYFNDFRGVFDGQGYVISNLEMASPYGYVGLFGYSEGLTIKNVILDSSCSITRSFSGSENAYVGGIIGECHGSCNIENSVNMGSVSFSGTLSSNYNKDSLYIGGIAGCLYSMSYKSTMKNCANYGSVTHSGKSRNSYIGGIAGELRGATSRVHIYNCLNHGTIIYSGTTSQRFYRGGITGYSDSVYFTNCVNSGSVSSTGRVGSSITGEIVGYVYYQIYFNYCYYTGYTMYGEAFHTPTESNTFRFDSITFELSEAASIGNYTGNSLTGALNAYAVEYGDHDYSYWIFNKEEKTVSFAINGRTNPIKMDYKIVLLPNLVSEGKMNFDGWYTDSELTIPLTSSEITGETKLYGKYYCPNLTVTLDVNGGDKLTVKEMTIDCDRVYGDIPTPKRTGYTFVGWFTEEDGKGMLIVPNTTVRINQNHTLYAQWVKNSRQVKIVFKSNNLTQEEIEETVEKYADTDFAVIKIDNGHKDGTQAIIEFDSIEIAKAFIEAVNSSSEAKGTIKKVEFYNKEDGSFSTRYYPMLLFVY